MASDDRQETVEDVVEELRSDNGFPVPYAPNGYRAIWKDDCTNYIDRIMEAWKRERAEIEAQALSIGGIVESSRHTQKPQGNAAALREAVVALLDALDSLWCDESTATLAALVPDMADSSARCLAAFRKAKAALSAPARNCDVGTAEEQMKRQYDTMCNTTNACPDSDWSCKECFAQWAQTPYEQKGEGDGM